MLFFSDKKGVRPDIEEFSNTACLFRLVLCDFLVLGSLKCYPG